MLCPSNPAEGSIVLTDLVNFVVPNGNCVDWLGRTPYQDTSGATIINPCRQISALAPGAERAPVIAERLLDAHYNTNYTSSWYLVRGGVLLDASGNLRDLIPGCGSGLSSRNSTSGPLSRADIDSSKVASATIPLMGDGGVADVLATSIGALQGGTPLAHSFTSGPLCKATIGGVQARSVPAFAPGTPKTGADGWWNVWAKLTLQDYSQFAPVHRGSCNILFADGSVRAFSDENDDGFVNNGFAAYPDLNTTAKEEMKVEDVASWYSLSDGP
jgi:prepilin-type processing-associated H-X9-DG protein